MNAGVIVLIYIAIFIISAVFLRVPVAFSMGITALIMFAILKIPMLNYAQAINITLDSFPLLAVPFFIFAGGLMQYSGISKSLIKLIDQIAGRLRASLGIVTVLASLAFGVLTGSNIATLSTIGGMMIPEMNRKGYKKAFSGALVAACAFLGTLIPPSVPGIMFALSGGQKVPEVWISTVGPGILVAVGYMIWILISQWNTEPRGEHSKLILGDYFTNIGKQTILSFPALLMPLIIFGGIYGGIFTPTEAGAISCLYGLLYFGFQKYFRHMKIERGLGRIVRDSMASTAMICCLMAFARAAGYTFTLSGVANELALFITAHITDKYVFLIVLNIILLIEGTFVDLNSGILIMTPLLMPTVLQFGIDPIHFGAMLLLNLSVGTITPPMASCLYFGASLAKADVVETMKQILPFVLVGIIVIFLTAFFPVISMGLVNVIR